MSDDLRRQMIVLVPRLRRFAYSLSGTLEDADDLVQAACERALLRHEQFVPGTRLDSWMFRIVQTIWIDRGRSAARRKTTTDPDALALVPHDARIHESMEARSDLELVRAEVQQMPEEQRVVLALVAVDGMSYQEAADTIGIPIGTVMSRLARARRRLADALERPPAAQRMSIAKRDGTAR